ncbi:long-chain acyl-CoA synthetase [Tumebacillus sp. BK434]|uniref:AMP-dependent synthetase/ligase n=1 Tax=Tumebacillus sp. BK434 TaxID=2512169 RepID=UPI001047A5ED|nr:long-chain fatty acid--CoA ligase [Tumebacillus sp. BK434]TCP55444.1 long-chain acyl-CoA synthetase [Tumebacillus sp. BK434]
MRNLPAMLHETVSSYHNRDALLWKEDGIWHRMTYSVFWQRIQSLAYGLQKLGIQAQSKVAILSNNRPDWTIADYAILTLGAISVPIYPTLTEAQIGYILDNGDVEIVFAETPELAEKVRSAATDKLRYIILFQPGPLANNTSVLAYRDVLETGYQLLEAQGQLDTWQEVEEQDIATICYTSGTTGNPKGVMLTHGNLITNIVETGKYIPITTGDTKLSHLPLSHIFERTCGQFTATLSGATIAYAEDISTVAANIVEVKPTLLMSVPRFYEKVYAGVMKTVQDSSGFKRWLFRTAIRSGVKHSQKPTLGTRLFRPLFDKLVYSKVRAKMGGNLRLLVSGGAALSPYIAEFFHAIGLSVSEGYGLTETSPVISTNPLDAIRIGTVGRPIPGLEIKTEEDGEILVKGPSIMTGYYKDPQATAEAFDEAGWFRTGDIGALQDGYLRIVERKKNILVLTTGKNVAPFPIESALSRSPYISQAILFGDRRKYVTALIVPDFPALSEWADRQSLPPGRHKMLQQQAVTELYSREIERTLQDFAPFEIPKKFSLLARDLTLEDGELTPSMKVRTHVLQNNYRAEIDSMYEESENSEEIEKKADNLASM